METPITFASFKTLRFRSTFRVLVRRDRMRWQIPVLLIVWIAGAYLCGRVDPTAVQLYITITIFVLIARNLGNRRDGLSAYSVFNRGCMPLLGQLRPDQFENEIRHRPL